MQTKLHTQANQLWFLERWSVTSTVSMRPSLLELSRSSLLCGFQLSLWASLRVLNGICFGCCLARKYNTVACVRLRIQHHHLEPLTQIQSMRAFLDLVCSLATGGYTGLLGAFAVYFCLGMLRIPGQSVFHMCAGYVIGAVWAVPLCILVRKYGIMIASSVNNFCAGVLQFVLLSVLAGFRVCKR